MPSSWNRPRLFFCEGFCEEQVIIQCTYYNTPVTGTRGQDVIMSSSELLIPDSHWFMPVCPQILVYYVSGK